MTNIGGPSSDTYCFSSFLSSPLVPLLPIIPPSLALSYSASVQAFQACWHDSSWTAHARSVVGRAALVAVAAVSSVGIRSGKGRGLHTGNLFAVGGSIVSAVISAWLVKRTRQIYIQGPRAELAEGSPDGRVVLITGCNTGIGYETAKQLYDAGATIVLGCRSKSRAMEAMYSIIESTSCMKPDRKRLIFLQIDVSDLSSVRLAAKTFKDMSLPLHTLVLNAGIMMSEQRESVDGFELMMACNHLGHFLLTSLLMPLLQAADDARVIVLTSSTYTLAKPGGIDLNDMQCRKRKYTMFSQYAQTKLANILFVKELARREQKRFATSEVKAYAVHPGLVRTDVVRNMPWYLYYPNIIFGFAVATLQKTSEAGAWTSVWCATSAELGTESGNYYANSRQEKVDDVANDDVAASRLWELSEKLVGVQ
mmetsp:Transcript_17396/g.38474  ORF Transcript_17396/g.38474 Transcript_17396/m.38474 type:complete len:423 (+) Transcript_17396:138-1406(+)